MNKLILIDGDIVAYKTAFSVQTPVYICKNAIYKTKKAAEKAGAANGGTVVKRMNIGSEIELRKKLRAQMKDIMATVGSEDYKLFLTASSVAHNFRSKIATIQPYKGNRKDAIRPVHYNRIRDILVKEMGAILVVGKEADDALAEAQIASFKEREDYEGTIIASIDKDMLTVPGWHYNFNKQTIDFVDEQEAFYNLFYQVLAGDTADNIPGLARILKLGRNEEGYKELIHYKYLRKYEENCIDKSPIECYDYVRGIYEYYNIHEEVMREVFNLLWLQRYEEQDGHKDFLDGYVL